MSATELKKIISNIHDLPSLPMVVNKILQVSGDSNSDAGDLANIINKDQSLTAKVLKLVNSAFYGFSQKISTISHGVAILGFYTIKNLTLGLSVFGSFDKNKGDSLLNRQEFWEHSLACGACCKLIAVKTNYDVPEEVFVAGLLHDIGMLIFDTYIREDYNKVLLLVKERNVPLIEAERDILGVNHYVMGEWLATEWKLPLLLRNAIKYQGIPSSIHRIPDNKLLKVSSMVHISHILCPIKSLCSDNENLSIDPQICKVVNMDEADISNIISKIKQEVKKAMVFFGIEGYGA